MSAELPADFSIVEIGGVLVASDYVETLTSAGLNCADAFFGAIEGQALNKPGLDSWRQRLRLQLDHSGRQVDFFLKRFFDPPFRALREVRRSGSGARSVAGVEWCWMQQLSSAGIACPKPVALVEQFMDGRESRSAVLMRTVPGQSLERWAQRWVDSGVEYLIRRMLIERTADFIARLHDCGFVHRDLYLSHIFWNDDNAGEGDLWLIDLQRLFRTRWRRRRWIIKDLASLDFSTPPALISRTDRIRWLKRYLDVPKLDRFARRLARAVAAKGKRIAARDARRRRRLEAPDPEGSPP
ncbi:MAG: hypothetical protein J5J06_10300 [Phycisphaerae bacterium]|nr:hypothetical protein [Phycisphaerae bacterium]